MQQTRKKFPGLSETPQRECTEPYLKKKGDVLILMPCSESGPKAANFQLANSRQGTQIAANDWDIKSNYYKEVGFKKSRKSASIVLEKTALLCVTKKRFTFMDLIR